MPRHRFCFLIVFVVTSWHQPTGSTILGDQLQTNKSETVTVNWKPGTFRGLVVGKSHFKDVIRILGKPKNKTLGEIDPRTGKAAVCWYRYENDGNISGQVDVIVNLNADIVEEIDLVPRSLTKNQAIMHFGRDFLERRYDFCTGFEESAPIYESPIGSLTYLEYERQGIAVQLDHLNRVTLISYVDKPIGFRSRANCDQELLRLRR